jgi:hypothetical protein
MVEAAGTNINAWSMFSSSELDKAKQTLGTSQLPNMSELSDTQMQALNKAFGFDVGAVVMINEAIAGELTETQQPRGVETPKLEKPDVGGEADLLSTLMQLKEKLGNIQIGTAKEGVKAQKLKLENVRKEKMEKIKETLDKMSEQSGWGLAGKILGWSGAVLGLAVAVTVSAVAVGAALFTGGSSLLALTLTLPAVGVACAGIGLMVLEETGAMEEIMDFMADNPWTALLIFSPVVGGTLWALRESDVLDEETFKVIMQVGIAATMVVASLAAGALTLGAGGVGGLGAAANAIGQAFNIGTKVTQTAVTAVKVTATLAQLGSQLASSLLQIGQGVTSIGSGVTGYQVAESEAQTKEFQAWLAKLQAALEEDSQALEEAIEKLNNDMKTGSEIASSINDTNLSTISRMGTA